MKCHCWKNAEEIAQDSLGMACVGQWSQVAFSIFQHHSSAHGGEREWWQPCQPWIKQLHLTDRALSAVLQQGRAILKFLGWSGTVSAHHSIGWLVIKFSCSRALIEICQHWVVSCPSLWHTPSHINQFFGEGTDPSALSDGPRDQAIPHKGCKPSGSFQGFSPCRHSGCGLPALSSKDSKMK